MSKDQYQAHDYYFMDELLSDRLIKDKIIDFVGSDLE